MGTAVSIFYLCSLFMFYCESLLNSNCFFGISIFFAIFVRLWCGTLFANGRMPRMIACVFFVYEA